MLFAQENDDDPVGWPQFDLPLADWAIFADRLFLFTNDFLQIKTIWRFLELALGDQVTGIAGLKSQLQVAGTATTTSTADVSHAGEELDEMKQPGDAEANQASPLNGPNGAKVSSP